MLVSVQKTCDLRGLPEGQGLHRESLNVRKLEKAGTQVDLPQKESGKRSLVKASEKVTESVPKRKK